MILFDGTSNVKPQDVKEVWFAGVHGDVGGGYPENESGLTNLPLTWMINETWPLGLDYAPRTVNEIVAGKSGKYVAPNAMTPMQQSLRSLWRPSNSSHAGCLKPPSAKAPPCWAGISRCSTGGGSRRMPHFIRRWRSDGPASLTTVPINRRTCRSRKTTDGFQEPVLRRDVIAGKAVTSDLTPRRMLFIYPLS